MICYQGSKFFEVDYVDDALAHERLALWPLSPSRWVVWSPDGDECIEAMDGSDPATWPSGSRPLFGRGGGVPPLYRFRAKGPRAEGRDDPWAWAGRCRSGRL
jgi:hypothetical protein